MRVLIVNGYCNNPKGREAFARFQELIQETLLNQKDASDVAYEFLIRNRDDLDEFLYELDSAYNNRQAAKAFDHIDMVFIEGDANQLPWSPSCSKILILLRMCLRAKKILFASAFAMQALVFLAASNVDKEVKIVNNNGKGGKIGDIVNIHLSPAEVKADEYFLDNVTGDLYSYNSIKNEWMPKMNVGIHNAKAAQSYDSLGKFIIKTPVYKPKTRGDHSLSYVSKELEDVCFLKKVYLQHWVLQGLPYEFKIPAKNSWHIHQFNFVNPRKTFVTMADSSRCPQMIYFDSFCVGTLFDINRKYGATIKILENFIQTKVKEIKGMEKEKFVSIEQTSNKLREFGGGQNFTGFVEPTEENHGLKSKRIGSAQRSTSIRILRNSNTGDRPKTSNGFHSGLAITNHDGPPLLVENNTVRNNFIIRGQVSKNIDRKREMEETNVRSIVFQTPVVNDRIRPESSLGTAYTNSRNRVGTSNSRNQRGGYNDEYIYEDDDRRNSFKHFMPNNNSNSRYGSKSGILKSSKHEKSDCEKGRGEIMMMLYPEITKELVKEEGVWIPGHLSDSKVFNTVNERKSVRLQSASGSRFYSTFNKFKGYNVDQARSTPFISRDSEYLTEEERFRRGEKELAKKNISPSPFMVGKKAAKQWFIPNYVVQSYSEPATNHKFRESTKNKWVGGVFQVY